MKILAGKFKGKVIKRKVPNGVRPTQDSVKESVFNTLINMVDFEDAVVADVCAGTGALGFEALSRGAKKTYFIEKSKTTVDFLQSTARELRCLPDEYEILFADAIYGLKSLITERNDVQFDIIFTDPPYESTIPNEILALAAKSNLLAEDGIIVVEISTGESLIVPDELEIFKEKIYGGTKIVYLSSSSS
jgi:16S rRNA (guanine966-N2)-methyltransferase